VRLRYPLEDALRGLGFLFEFGESVLAIDMRLLTFLPRLRRRAHARVQRRPAGADLRAVILGNGPNTVCVNVISVPLVVSLRRYIRFDVARWT
jgi:hypothetical protein